MGSIVQFACMASRRPKRAAVASMSRRAPCGSCVSTGARGRCSRCARARCWPGGWARARRFTTNERRRPESAVQPCSTARAASSAVCNSWAWKPSLRRASTANTFRAAWRIGAGPRPVLRVTQLSVSSTGVAYAVCSGAITSGLGYIVWYTVLPHLRSSAAATVQLSVPLLAAIGGTLLLGEAWTQRLSWTGLAILGGIALVVVAPKRLTRV